MATGFYIVALTDPWGNEVHHSSLETLSNAESFASLLMAYQRPIDTLVSIYYQPPPALALRYRWKRTPTGWQRMTLADLALAARRGS